MRNQALRSASRGLVPAILAALAAFWAASPAAAAEAQMTRTSDKVVEISGGSGKEAWRLRYGIALGRGFQPHFVTSEGNRAWYSYGGWLRLIDTQKGIVIGRWHYPAEIVSLRPQGAKIQVVTGEKTGMGDQTLCRTLDLDPAAPHVPYWPTNPSGHYRVSYEEPIMLWSGLFTDEKIPLEQAKQMIPEMEEAVRRDPLSPFFRFALGKTLNDIGDPRATEVFQQAIATPSTDYTELLFIATIYDTLGQNELARAAFERGYRDFWQRGNDPRMLIALLDRLFLFLPTGPDWPRVSPSPATPQGREMIERVYSLGPWGEVPLAWRLYADYLSTHGYAQEASLWQQRAEDAEENSYTLESRSDLTDLFLAMSVAAGLAALLYALILFARYQRQSRLDLIARKQATGVSRIAAILNAHHWSLKERIAFFSIVFIGWFSLGLAGRYAAADLRFVGLPISAGAGSLAGPISIDHFEHYLPATPQRDLLLAIAYQQDGQTERAERLYRSLPQFAESWNNLGVILKGAGKEQEARAAFERALQLDPKMAEAALNLGRPPSDFWTEQHQKYLPGKPMIAPPRGPIWKRALLGGSAAAVCLKALGGPFAAGDLLRFLRQLRR